MARFPILLLALLPLLLSGGCGTPGAPTAPSLRLPAPVQDLAASRTANSVSLTWTMPARTTDRILLKNPVPVAILRTLESGSPVTIASLSVNPGKPGKYTDHLPSDLTEGSPRLLVYEIQLRNHAQKTAGPSNPAYSVAGASPAPLVGLTGRVRRDGVLLLWHPATQAPQPESSITFRIERVLETAAEPATELKNPLAPAPPPADQFLAVRASGKDPGSALDMDAQPGQRYRYEIRRVATVRLAGRNIDIEGEPSESIEVSTADVFPPEVPRGLVAVADVDANAIDLSWSEQADRDLAGFYVYRRDLGGSLPVERITSQVLSSPAFRDTGVMAGHSYAYSISAIDRRGNESARTGEVIERLPRASR